MSTVSSSSKPTVLLLPVLSVLPALGVGITLMLAGEAPRVLPALNAVAFLAGLVLLLVLSRLPPTAVVARLPLLALLSLGLIAVTLLSPGSEGVRRWLVLGPVRLHVSAILAPVVLLGAEELLRRGGQVRGLGLLLAAQLLHVAQPDAGQATALAAGAVGLACTLPSSGRSRVLLGSGPLLLAALSWTSPDPLLPADFVEDILSRAFHSGPLLGALALAALCMLSAGPLLMARQSPGSPLPAASCLAFYLAASAAVAATGRFPTPVLGHGASPVLGAMLGLGLLAQRSRVSAQAEG